MTNKIERKHTFIKKSDALKYGEAITKDYIELKDIEKYKDIIKNELNLYRDLTTKDLMKLRNVYREYKNDPELDFKYKIAFEFRHRDPLHGYNLDYFNNILKLSDDKLINYIKDNNISEKTIKSFKDVYNKYFNKEINNINKLDYILENAFIKEEYTKEKRTWNNITDTGINFKSALEEYVNSDLDTIKEILPKHNLSYDQFKTCMRTKYADKSIEELQHLYKIRFQSLLASNEDEINKIYNFVMNGVPVDGKDNFMKFNEIYYYMNTTLKPKVLLEYAFRILSRGSYDRLKSFINTFHLGSKYDNAEDLIENSYCKINGQELDEETKRKLICFMNYYNMPLNNEILYRAYSMYLNNEIDVNINSFRR